MKSSSIRITTAVILSLVIHVALLCTESGFRMSGIVLPRKYHRVSMTLAPRRLQQVKPGVEPVVEADAVADSPVLEKKAPVPIIEPVANKVVSSRKAEPRRLAPTDIVVREIPKPQVIPDTPARWNFGPLKEDAKPVGEENVSSPAVATRSAAVDATPLPVREARPRYRENSPPRYPVAARRFGQQGTVLLDVLVDKTGRVNDLRVHKSSGYGRLDEAALKSVRDWLFEPGRRDGQEVEMWVQVPVRFQIR